MKKRIKKKSKTNLNALNKEKSHFFLIPLRYIILLVLILSVKIIYFIATPLTVYPVIFILKFFVNVSLIMSGLDPLLILGNITRISIVQACIAGSAYLLLFILNLSVTMPIKKRIFSIILSIVILLAFNILRIVFFSLLYHYRVPFVNFTHMLFWYVISTIFVIGLWFLNVKIFKIKEIPVYSDIKYVYNKIKHDK